MTTTLLSMNRLAKALGVSAGTIHTWTMQGAIHPVIREGKIYRFDLDQVLEHLAERAKQSKP
jgi:predicted site-specific integrase-resolvase